MANMFNSVEKVDFNYIHRGRFLIFYSSELPEPQNVYKVNVTICGGLSYFNHRLTGIIESSCAPCKC